MSQKQAKRRRREQRARARQEASSQIGVARDQNQVDGGPDPEDP